MAKNNHHNADMAERLDNMFSEQFVSSEESDDKNLNKYLGIAATYALVESSMAVLSDLKSKRS